MQVTLKAILKLYFPLTVFITGLVSWGFYEERPKNVLWSDAEGYYMYLPAVFIYDGFERVPLQSGQMTTLEGTNKVYTKYTCGVAILEMPFFLLAHAYSKIAGKDTSGYSSVNNLGIRAAAIFYAMLGLYFLRKVLRSYFSEIITAITLLAVYFGTNLFYYTVQEAGMSHAYSFFLFALFAWKTPQFIHRPTYKNAVILSFILGLIILIRPTNCLIALYVLLFEVYSFKALQDRLLFLIKQLRVLWVMPLIVFACFLPQFYYWYYMSGNFVIYSYNQEGFIFWKNPKLFKIFFDVQNGWLIYSPVMIFSVIGLFISIYKKQVSGIGIGLLTAVASYIFASWWAWWFGGAFGYRSLIEFYVFLSSPFAYFLFVVSQSKFKKLTYLIIPLIAFGIYYNVRLTYLYAPPWDGPNWTWETFGEVLKKL